MTIWLPGTLVLTIMAVRRLGRDDLWLDEAFSLAAAVDLPTSLDGDRGAMAVYYALLAPWATISHDPAWLRALSLLAAVAGVAILAITVSRMVGPVAGRVAGILAGASPLVIRYAVEARAYGLVLLLVAVCWYALDRCIDQPDEARWGVVFTVSATLVPLTHGLAIIQVGAMAAAVAWARPDRRALRRTAPGFLGAGGAIAALLSIGANDIGSWVPPLTSRSVRAYAIDIAHPWGPVALLLALFGTVGAWMLLRAGHQRTPLARFRQVAFVLWGPVAVVGLLALSVVRPSFVSRYALASALGLAALIAVVVASSRMAAGLTVVLAGLLLLPQATLAPRQPTWVAAAETLAERHRAGDAVIFATPDARMPFEAAWASLGDPPDLVVVGPGAPLGHFDRFAPVATSAQLADDASRHERVWVVEQPYHHQPSRLDDLLASPQLVGNHTEVDRWTIPAPVAPIELILLSR